MDPNSDFFTSYTYDYLSRVVRERRYEWDSYTLDWEATPAVDQRFMYYKRMKLLTLGLDDDEVVPLYKFVYGPGTDGRLGGPGSLLAIRDVSGGGTLDLVCFHNGGGKLVDLVVRDTSFVSYENYELVVSRGAYEGGCWSPPWSPSCDACGDCFSGWWVDTRIAQPGAPGYCMDVAVPVCHCGDPSSDPGTQRVEPGVDDPCIKTGSPTGCGGCSAGTLPPGWVDVMCVPVPEEEEEDDKEDKGDDKDPCYEECRSKYPGDDDGSVRKFWACWNGCLEGKNNPNVDCEEYCEAVAEKYQWNLEACKNACAKARMAACLGNKVKVLRAWCGDEDKKSPSDEEKAEVYMLLICRFANATSEVAYAECTKSGAACIMSAGSKNDLCMCLLRAAGLTYWPE